VEEARLAGPFAGRQLDGDGGEVAARRQALKFILAPRQIVPLLFDEERRARSVEGEKRRLRAHDGRPFGVEQAAADLVLPTYVEARIGVRAHVQRHELLMRLAAEDELFCGGEVERVALGHDGARLVLAAGHPGEAVAPVSVRDRHVSPSLALVNHFLDDDFDARERRVQGD
jgi:hypothetical protein